VQFGSRADWRRHIPIGASTINIGPAYWYYDVGDVLDVGGRDVVRVVGMEPGRLGVRPTGHP
jgi:hypothetical protein